MTPILYMSLRSPFARRVRLALEELQIGHTTEILDVFNLPPAYLGVNPLGRVPVLKTERGQFIIDSWMIVDYLKSRHENHPLYLFGASDGAELRSLSGLAVGIMEHSVAAFLERSRGPGLVSPEHYREAVEVVGRGLEALERRAATNTSEFFTGDVLRQCDLDLGSALAYAELRIKGALDGRPALRAYLERLNRRESFRKTVPPA